MPLKAMDVTIRRAEARDVPGMLSLVKELAAFEKEPDAVTVSEQHMLDAGFGPDAVWWGWVAEERSEGGGEATMLGIALCYERYSTWRGRVAYLEDIVVTEAARGQGIGDRLFKACAAYALENGFAHMSWQVLDWNEGAIRFYERAGAELSHEWVNGKLDRTALKALLVR